MAVPERTTPSDDSVRDFIIAACVAPESDHASGTLDQAAAILAAHPNLAPQAFKLPQFSVTRLRWASSFLKIRPMLARETRRLQATGVKNLAVSVDQWEITTMKTLKVDAHKRIRISEFRPGQVFSYTRSGDDSFTLTLVNTGQKHAFPPGSLLKYFTPRKNKEELALLAGCSIEVPE